MERFHKCCPGSIASLSMRARAPGSANPASACPFTRLSHPSAEALPQSPLAGFWRLASRALARGVAPTFRRAGNFQSRVGREEPVLDVGPTGQAAKGASHARYASRSTQRKRCDASLHNPAARARRAAAQRPGT